MNSQAYRKVERLRHVVSHHEADRVPAGDFFWTGFLKRCRDKWGQDFDPYRYFDLDYVVVSPNIDPKIQPFELVKQSADDIVIRTGFGATIRRRGDAPMPYYEAFSVDIPEKMADFGFDSPSDPRRFFQGGDDQANCVGDVLLRDIPSWEERLLPYLDDFAVFGCMQEAYEYIWRIVGSENALTWMLTHSDLFGEFVDRIGEFLLALCEAQIKAGNGRLSGMFIAGDVAYRKGMLFSPVRWRALFKPHVKRLVDLCHKHGLMVIFHGCGNPIEILDDLCEIGVDVYNPVEAKAGLDVTELKDVYGGRLAFCGNIDVTVLERNNPEEIKSEVLYKLQAAKGGGWIFHSDHSVSSSVAPESYELAIKVLREYGSYPLSL